MQHWFSTQCQGIASCSLFCVHSVEMATWVIYCYSSHWPLVQSSEDCAQVESLTKNVQFPQI